MLSVGAVVSKSKYIAKGKSPFESKLSSKLIKFLLLKLYIAPRILAQFSVFLCLSGHFKKFLQ